jgi:hypothetical protein
LLGGRRDRLDPDLEVRPPPLVRSGVRRVRDEEDDVRLPEEDDVLVVHALALHADAVHVRPVRRAQVLDPVGVVLEEESSVVPAHPGIVYAHGSGVAVTDDDLAAADLDRGPLPLPVQDLETRHTIPPTVAFAR